MLLDISPVLFEIKVVIIVSYGYTFLKFFMKKLHFSSKAESSKKGPRKGRSIWVDGKRYPSIAEASRQTKVSVGKLRKRANDPLDPNVYFEDQN